MPGTIAGSFHNVADAQEQARERRHLRRLIIPHQPESEMGGRGANGAAARLRVVDEIGNIAAMFAGDDPHPAIDRGSLIGAAGGVERLANETGIGPFPDIAGDVEKSVLVGTKGTERP